MHPLLRQPRAGARLCRKGRGIIPAYIVMPSNAPQIKRTAVEEGYGAKVFECAPTQQAREAEALRLQ